MSEAGAIHPICFRPIVLKNSGRDAECRNWTKSEKSAPSDINSLAQQPAPQICSKRLKLAQGRVFQHYPSIADARARPLCGSAGGHEAGRHGTKVLRLTSPPGHLNGARGGFSPNISLTTQRNRAATLSGTMGRSGSHHQTTRKDQAKDHRTSALAAPQARRLTSTPKRGRHSAKLRRELRQMC